MSRKQKGVFPGRGRECPGRGGVCPGRGRVSRNMESVSRERESVFRKRACVSRKKSSHALSHGGGTAAQFIRSHHEPATFGKQSLIPRANQFLANLFRKAPSWSKARSRGRKRGSSVLPFSGK